MWVCISGKMTFTIQNFEIFLFILVRVSAFVSTAPFFSQSNTPRRLKAFLAVFISVIVVQVSEFETVTYSGVIGFAIIVLKEAIVGLLVGFMARVCLYILEFSGKLIDMEIGFSMVQTLDPSTNIESSITGTLYSTLVMLMLMLTDMHHFILSAAIDSFRLVPIGEALFKPSLYLIMTDFITDYFVIAFRIILPVFCCILIVNVVLGILAKVAQQMNMFVIGMQLKILMGLSILVLVAGFIPVVSDFLFQEMKQLMSSIIQAVAP